MGWEACPRHPSIFPACCIFPACYICLPLAALFALGYTGGGGAGGGSLVLLGKRAEFHTQEDREGKPSPGRHVSNHCPPSCRQWRAVSQAA